MSTSESTTLDLLRFAAINSLKFKKTRCGSSRASPSCVRLEDEHMLMEHNIHVERPGSLNEGDAHGPEATWKH